ncbi:MAG: hypothetical protein HY234_00395 [Acidobacteria bacterium]|nr:hypothetical protein [Acidobacteriota bacterium]MBI3661500.1 hypothetical protein [Acidobacteriota bacterium]
MELGLSSDLGALAWQFSKWDQWHEWQLDASPSRNSSTFSDPEACCLQQRPLRRAAYRATHDAAGTVTDKYVFFGGKTHGGPGGGEGVSTCATAKVASLQGVC